MGGAQIEVLGDERNYRRIIRSSPLKIIHLLCIWRMWFVGVLEVNPEAIVVFRGLDSGKTCQVDNTYVFSLKIMPLWYVW